MARSRAQAAEATPPPTEIAAEWVARTSLVPCAENPRDNAATIPVVADSIRRFGFGAPMVARHANRMLLAGHARLGAAQLLEEQWAKATSRERSTWHPDAVRVATRGEVVVRFLELDEHDAKLYLLADNRIGEELSITDDERVRSILESIRAEKPEADLLTGVGFTEASLAELLEGAPRDAAGATGADPGEGRYQEQYGVIVLCQNEGEQARVYDQLQRLGLPCRVVVT